MTREEFIEILDREGYSYEIEGDKIIVNRKGDTRELRSLTSLPPGVVFKNGGNVWLGSITSLPPGVEFENKGNVDLYSLTSIPPDVVFKNVGYVWLESLQSLPPGVEFNNEGRVWLNSIIGGWFNEWEGNIRGIDDKRLMHLMISKGVFER